MAEEVKDDTVNEETETETETDTIDSASEVTTSPTVETPNDDKFVQLEQRITSLEQRFNGQEQQQQQSQEPPSQKDTSSNEQSENDDNDSGDGSDGMESNDEIKKILGL